MTPLRTRFSSVSICGGEGKEDRKTEVVFVVGSFSFYGYIIEEGDSKIDRKEGRNKEG